MKGKHAPSKPHRPLITAAHTNRLLKIVASDQRLAVALRASLCVGIPVALGWALGDVSAGLMATIGAFTSLYAADRPYLNRALVLAGIAFSFALAVSLGMWTQQLPVTAVPAVVAIAVVATFLCNSLLIGAPGAYMFVLACAAGTAIPIAHRSVLQASLLVLSGGLLSWTAHMTGALVQPRGPERTAVFNAAKAVADFAEMTSFKDLDTARNSAARALHDVWVVLVTLQPGGFHPSRALIDLRALARELHLIFAACVSTAGNPRAESELLAKRAWEIGTSARSPYPEDKVKNGPAEPLGRLSVTGLLLDNLDLRSPALAAAARVGFAVAMAGAIGMALSLERAYWAMAAAALVLHQGLDWSRTLRRGLARMCGTLAGLCVAAIVFAVHPNGLWLVATLMVCQFLTEELVTRSYALAVVFVTTIALIIASGGHAVQDARSLLAARGVDTIIGCFVGLLVFILTGHRSSDAAVRHDIAETLALMPQALEYVLTGQVTSAGALRIRRDLQHRIFALTTSYDTHTGGLKRDRITATRLSATVAASQRLGYKILATCWLLEGAKEDPALRCLIRVTPDVVAESVRALRLLATALQTGASAPKLTPLPDFLRAEIQELRDSMERELA